MSIYRIYPVLWNECAYTQAQTVYAIDRPPPPDTFPTMCSSRPKEDPAYWWHSPTFQRIVLPTTYGRTSVTWSNLPEWLSYISSLGYTPNVDFSSIKPFSDVYITGP